MVDSRRTSLRGAPSGVRCASVGGAGLDLGEDFGGGVGGLRLLTHVLKSGTWGTRFCGFARLFGFAPCFGCFWGVVAEVFEEGLDDAHALGFGEFGARGQRAVDGVGDDLFDQIGFGCVAGLAAGRGFAGEVEAGDLEAVEEQAGAFGVDLVGRDALQDLADGGLDGAAVFGEG